MTSIVVAGEFYYGAAKSENVDGNWSSVNRFLSLLEVAPVSSSVAAEYARLKMALLNRYGPRECANDLWIAATAIDLAVEDWTRP